MNFRDPVPGQVIRYEFLWSHERAAGKIDASKSRPCAIVIAIPLSLSGDLQTVVVPITHTPPADSAASIPLPASVCKTLELDGENHWIRIDEVNSFAWPGIDLRPIPGKPGEYVYGILPRALFERVRKAILDRQAQRKAKIIPRTGA